MRRLLVTLTKIISEHSSDDKPLPLIDHAVNSANQAISKQNDIASIKPAIQVLEHFLSRNIINALQILQVATSKDLHQSTTGSMKQPAATSNILGRVEDFTVGVLEWVQYPDCAPGIGRLLPAFFESLELLIEQDFSPVRILGEGPLWMNPIRRSLEARPNLLEVYESHILPGLLRGIPANRLAFFQTLPLNEIQHGNVGIHPVTDIQLCLLAAKINWSSLKVSKAEAKPNNSANGSQVEIDAMRLGTNLLENPIPSVRLAALSLVISCTHTVPFSHDVFDLLQYFIPFFHLEVNARTRNEYVTLVKRFLVKLKSAVTFTLREGQILARSPLEQEYAQGSSQVAVHKISKFLLQVIVFQSWYMRFLDHELQPTASYQRHITALKILPPFLESYFSKSWFDLKLSSQYKETFDEFPSRVSMLRPLLDLVLDPFDDVRQAANSVLERHFSSSEPALTSPLDNGIQEGVQTTKLARPGTCTDKALLLALQRAESITAETGRASHADGVGKLYDLHLVIRGSLHKTPAIHDEAVKIVESLVQKLENEVEVANENLMIAINAPSLHGHLVALK